MGQVGSEHECGEFSGGRQAKRQRQQQQTHTAHVQQRAKPLPSALASASAPKPPLHQRRRLSKHRATAETQKFYIEFAIPAVVALLAQLARRAATNAERLLDWCVPRWLRCSAAVLCARGRALCVCARVVARSWCSLLSALIFGA